MESKDRPFVHLNLAVSEEGRMATRDGRPLAISCATDWRRVHLLRESYDGVAVGARTWRLDQPRLSVRREVLGRAPLRQPARVIFAGGQAIAVAPCADRRTFVIGRPSADLQGPDLAGATFVTCRDRDLAAPLAELARNGVRSLLVEGGPTLLRSFLDQGRFDLLTIFLPTTDAEAAQNAVAEALPNAPRLAAEAFADGVLLKATAPALGREAEPAGDRLPAGKVTYLDPDACGAANGGRRGERLALLGPVPLPIAVGGRRHVFAWSVFARVQAGEEAPRGVYANSVLAYGDIGNGPPPLVRIHSSCQTGDIFGSARCDCGPQLQEALAAIVDAGRGVAVYASDHEGRGVGLWNKACAYLLQDGGADTYEANRLLGFPEDSRHYDDAAVILAHLLGRRAIRLLSNNPAKKAALAKAGFEIAEMVGLLAGHNEVNRGYLEAKARRGHLLPAASPAAAVSLLSEKALPVGTGSR